jgi:ComF family protein
MLTKTILTDPLHLFYPHTCTGCGSDLLANDQLLCLRCIKELPHTHYAKYPGNVIERIFTGRIPVKAAHSEFYFSKSETIQHLIHQLKYRGNKDIGQYLGEITGDSILKSGRFSNIDMLVPLPLYADKQFKRGYNQAEIICNGISLSTNIPVQINNLIRQRATETQTRKHRTDRWQNVEGSFNILKPGLLNGKSLLLVDDVITTGATLEACGQAILKYTNATISIVALAYVSK